MVARRNKKQNILRMMSVATVTAAALLLVVVLACGVVADDPYGHNDDPYFIDVGADSGNGSAAGNGTANMNATNCIFVVGNNTFDLRRIAGVYSASDPNGSDYRYALCVQPPECNGVDNVVICQHYFLAKKYKIEAALESGLGTLPASKVGLRANDSALQIAYGENAFDAVLQQLQQLGAFMTLAVEMIFPDTPLANETIERIQEAEWAVRRLRRSSFVTFVCKPDGRPEDSVDFRFHNTTYSEATNYEFQLKHYCACANVSCPPLQARLPLPECHDDWRYYLRHNMPALAVVAILILYEAAITVSATMQQQRRRRQRLLRRRSRRFQRQELIQQEQEQLSAQEQGQAQRRQPQPAAAHSAPPLPGVRIQSASPQSTPPRSLSPSQPPQSLRNSSDVCVNVPLVAGDAELHENLNRSRSGPTNTAASGLSSPATTTLPRPVLHPLAPAPMLRGNSHNIPTAKREEENNNNNKNNEEEGGGNDDDIDELEDDSLLSCCRTSLLSWSWWRRWMPVPNNFLQRRQGRLVTCLIFGGFSSVALDSLIELVLMSSETSMIGSGSLLYSLWVVICMGLLCYPLALCRECSNRLLGSALGTAYTAVVLAFYVPTVDCLCTSGQVWPRGAGLFPTLLCLVALLVYFLFRLTRTLFRALTILARSAFGSRYSINGMSINWARISRVINRKDDPWKGLECYELRVKQLLVGCSRRRRQEEEAELEAAKARLIRSQQPWYRRLCGRARDGLRGRLYARQEYFLYSPRMLCMATVALLFLYQTVLLWVPTCATFADKVHAFMDTLRCDPDRITIALSKLPFADSVHLPEELVEAIPAADFSLDVGLSCSTDRLVHVIVRYCLTGAGVFSALVQVAFALHMLTCYRKHLRRLCVGDASFLPVKRSTSSVAIVDALKYAGYQIAYSIVGWIVMTIVTCIVGLFVTFAIVLPCLKIYADWLWMPYVVPHLWPLLVSALLYVGQLALVKGVLQAADSTYGVINHRLFHNCDFFLFFINIFVGFYSFIVRMAVNMVHGIIFISRLDKCMAGRGYEYWDQGYRTYVGFLLLEYSYSNPVAITFVRWLAQRHTLLASSQPHLSSSPASGRRDGGGNDSVDGCSTDFDDEGDNVSKTSRLRRVVVAAMGVASMMNDSDDEELIIGLVNNDQSDVKAAAQICYEMKQKVRRNRWSLYVTLINNPSLRRYRKWSARRQGMAAPDLVPRTVESQIWHLEQKLQRRANEATLQQQQQQMHTCTACGATVVNVSRCSSTLTLSSGFEYYPIIRDMALRQAAAAATSISPVRRRSSHRRTQSDEVKLVQVTAPLRAQFQLGAAPLRSNPAGSSRLPARRISVGAAAAATVSHAAPGGVIAAPGFGSMPPPPRRHHQRSVSFGSDVEMIRLEEEQEDDQEETSFATSNASSTLPSPYLSPQRPSLRRPSAQGPEGPDARHSLSAEDVPMENVFFPTNLRFTPGHSRLPSFDARMYGQ